MDWTRARRLRSTCGLGRDLPAAGVGAGPHLVWLVKDSQALRSGLPAARALLDLQQGGLAEWFKAQVLKTCVGFYPTVSSNLTPSAFFVSRRTPSLLTWSGRDSIHPLRIWHARFAAFTGSPQAINRGGEVSDGRDHRAEPWVFSAPNAIRGEAWWVLVFHFCGAIWGWDVAAWPQRFSTESGWIAVPGWVISRIVGAGGVRVPIFFVLSGFLIHLTFSRGVNQGVLAFGLFKRRDESTRRTSWPSWYLRSCTVRLDRQRAERLVGPSAAYSYLCGSHILQHQRFVLESRPRVSVLSPLSLAAGRAALARHRVPARDFARYALRNWHLCATDTRSIRR